VVLVGAAALAHYLHANDVLAFLVAAAAIALLAHIVGLATEQLGGRVGPSAAGVVQSGLGNLPELFISLFALHAGLIGVVQAALVGSVIANGVLVLGIAFLVGGLRHGVQRFDSPRARLIATLTVLAAAILSMPTLANAFHTPAAAHGRTLSYICAGVLIVLFVVTLPGFLGGGGEELEPARWSLTTTVLVLAAAATAAAVTSDWFVAALKPATEAMHMSQAFAGLVIVAIAGNAVENVVGVSLAARNQPDFSISVIVNSALQVALLLTPGARVREPLLRCDADAGLPDAARHRAAALCERHGARRLRRREPLGGGCDPDRPLRRDRRELLVGCLAGYGPWRSSTR
jgi:Ca2+:H+ antiporter